MDYPIQREVLDKIKSAMIDEAKKMREANKIISVSGERLTIRFADREISIIYYPTEEPKAPLLIGFHGGGFLFGGNALNDEMWNAIRKELHVNVASVEYRKSPEFQWKSSIFDAYDSAVYLKEHAEELNFDPENISVFGASAGANLAAAVCIYAKQKNNQMFKNQILFYPFLDLATDPAEKGKGSMDGPMLYVFNELRCMPNERHLALVSPVFADLKLLEGMPHAIICCAEDDCLKQEGLRYAEMLRDAGVEVEDMVADNMPHGYFETGFGEVKEEENQFLGEKVLKMVRDGTIAQVSMESLVFVKNHFIY